MTTETTDRPLYTLREDWDAFSEEVEKCRFSGPCAADKLLLLSKRVGSKRLKTVTRLLKGVRSFGCKVEFDCVEDGADTPFEPDDSCNGVFMELDHWIHLDLGKMKYWKNVEEVLAHEAVHLCQCVVFKGDRTGDDDMEISMDRIWSFYDTEKYRKWLDDTSEEEFPIYEVEAYSEMHRPKGVACSLEYLHSRPELWEGTYYCPAFPE